jgi:DNA-binding transcriptional regulator/RsmH inhibitor MraZ
VVKVGDNTTKVAQMRGRADDRRYQHTIDGKGRLFVPAKLRSELGEFFYITKGLDNCLSLYPNNNWLEIEEKISALPLSKSRIFSGCCFQALSAASLTVRGAYLFPKAQRIRRARQGGHNNRSFLQS